MKESRRHTITRIVSGQDQGEPDGRRCEIVLAEIELRSAPANSGGEELELSPLLLVRIVDRVTEDPGLDSTRSSEVRLERSLLVERPRSTRGGPGRAGKLHSHDPLAKRNNLGPYTGLENVALFVRAGLAPNIVEEMEPGETMYEFFRPVVLDSLGHGLRKDGTAFLVFEPGKIEIPGLGTPPTGQIFSTQVAGVNLQDETILRVQALTAENLVSVFLKVSGQEPFASRDLLPSHESLAEHVGHLPGTGGVDTGQEPATGGSTIDTLASASSPPVMSFLTKLLEVKTFGIIPILEPPDLVGGRNELGNEFLNRAIGPGRLPAPDSIVSGAGERVPIHRPEENGTVPLVGLDDRVPEGRFPGDTIPSHLGRPGKNKVSNPPEVGLGQFQGKGRSAKKWEDQKKIYPVSNHENLTEKRWQTTSSISAEDSRQRVRTRLELERR